MKPSSSYEDFRDKVLKDLPMTHGGHSVLTRWVGAFVGIILLFWAHCIRTMYLYYLLIIVIITITITIVLEVYMPCNWNPG